MRKKVKPVHVANARSQDQIQALKEIAAANFCPFCDMGYLKKHHPHPIRNGGKHWLYTDNRWPLKGSRQHLLFIHRQHIEHLRELSPSASLELIALANKLTKKFRLPGATLLMRYGDMSRTGGTVTHLHAQLISGDPKSSNPVIARVG